MALVDEGLVSLDEPVERLLPQLASPRVLRRMDGPLDDTVAGQREITVCDLLTFTGGFGMHVGVFMAAAPWPIMVAATEAQLATMGPPDTRAAMTAGSAVGSDLKESSVWGPWPDRRPWPGRKLADRYARFAQTCPDSAAAPEMRAAPNPRAFTRVVWGLTSRPPGSPGGLSSGFPFARRGSSPSPAFGWFPFVRRSPVVPVGRRPVRVPLRFPSGFPSPGRSSR